MGSRPGPCRRKISASTSGGYPAGPGARVAAAIGATTKGIKGNPAGGGTIGGGATTGAGKGITGATGGGATGGNTRKIGGPPGVRNGTTLPPGERGAEGKYWGAGWDIQKKLPAS